MKDPEKDAGLTSIVKARLKPGKDTVKWLLMFKGHHPLAYGILSKVIVVALVVMFFLTIIQGFIEYHAYIEDEDEKINVSTIQGPNILRTIDVFENAGLGSFFYTPVTWRLEANNPVGYVVMNDFDAVYNFTQNYNTLRVSFTGTYENTTYLSDDVEIFQRLVENVTSLDVEITQYGELYGAIDGETIITGVLEDSLLDNKLFKLNIYFGGLSYHDVLEIIECFKEKESLQEERYLVRELEDLFARDLRIRLDTGRFVPYYKITDGIQGGQGVQYINGILERELMGSPAGFDDWFEENEERLNQAGPVEFLEIIEEFTSVRLCPIRDAANCMDYTHLYYDAFYAAKIQADNQRIDGLHVFPVRSTVIMPGYLTEGGHLYLAVIMTSGNNLEISFIDPHWADQRFPSMLHLFMWSRRERFNAFDQFHHISISSTDFLVERKSTYRMNTFMMTVAFGSIFAILNVYFVYLFRSVKKIEEKVRT